MSTPVPREPGVDYETKAETIIMQDRAGRKRYEKMLQNGWEVESVTPRTWARGQTYLFRRPRRTPTAGQAAASLLDKLIDTSPEGMERARQKQQENKEAWAREREKTKQIMAERKEKRAAKKAEKDERKSAKKSAKKAAKEERKRG